jgi:hypothetical protein
LFEVAAVRTEREANRYAPLDETQRRVADEEEKRRSAEAEQNANVKSGYYAPLEETHRRVAEQETSRPAGREPSAAAPEREPLNEADGVHGRLAAKPKELEEKVQLGRITRSDMIHEMRQFDSELLREMNLNDERRGREEPASASGQKDRGRNDPGQARSQTSAEQDSASEEHEFPNRGERTDARAARMARLRGIDRDIERESRENQGKGLDAGRDSGDRSR